MLYYHRGVRMQSRFFKMSLRLDFSDQRFYARPAIKSFAVGDHREPFRGLLKHSSLLAEFRAQCPRLRALSITADMSRRWCWEWFFNDVHPKPSHRSATLVVMDNALNP